MPCDAVVVATATVKENSLVKLLKPEMVVELIKDALKKANVAMNEVQVKEYGRIRTVIKGNIEVDFNTETGMIKVSGGYGMESRVVAAELSNLLKRAAGMEMARKVADVVRARGGSVYDMKPMKEGWMLKVEGL